MRLPWPSVLGVIPARAGSVRLPGKNMLQVAGKPLVQWTIEAAEEAMSLTTYVVSTNDERVMRLASDLGCCVVKRPEELSRGDREGSMHVVRHALSWVEEETAPFDMVVLLHPTSPVRDPQHIDQAVEMLWNSGAPSLASVECRKRSYIHNASIYAMKREAFSNALHYSDQSLPFLMDRAHSIDIDEEIDLRLAELYLGGGADGRDGASPTPSGHAHAAGRAASRSASC